MGVPGKFLTEFSIRTVAEIQRHTRRDKGTVATWRLDLNGILQVFKHASRHFWMKVANFPLPE